ncbi:MAG: 2-oxo-4-hydroxy-4-carboxy-5-ureidoimidazoline decarboxylase [Acidobacteriota bacterium]|nr:2-oxo-4-hydroxy-4-carboxy-5-ureidoimidazoline decarboxylase [Acidobacteriota bacterium]
MLNREAAVRSAESANETLERWNAAEAKAAAREVLPCCGSQAWAEALAARKPLAGADEVFAASDAIWQNLGEDDWRQAFDSHPRIGQRHARSATGESLAWSGDEQRAAMTQEQAAREALAEANREYEARFGRIFIICATGKSAEEIVRRCRQRMSNDAATEMLESAEQQRQITQLRLRRWLGVN